MHDVLCRQKVKLDYIYNRALNPVEKDIAKEMFKRIGPQGILDLSNRMNEDKAAFKQAKKVRLSTSAKMKDVLRMYPINIVKGIAHEWDLDQHKTKDQLIQDITNVMTSLIPRILDGAGDSERDAIRYIAKQGTMRINRARRILNDSLIQPEFVDSNDSHMFDSFMTVYVRMGILIVGVRNIKGKDREIITLASDVKRIVALHTGWDIALDQDTPNSDAENLQEPTDDTSGTESLGQHKSIMKLMRHDPSMHHKGPSIFKPDMVEIKPGQILTDPFEAMTAYAITKYRNEFNAERDNCHYDVENIDNNTLVFKQQMTWFLAEWINPVTGTTITEEFVKETVRDKKLAMMLMQFTELFFDRFEVRAHRGDGIIAYGVNTRKTYRIATANKSIYPVGITFEGRIHPYEGNYKLTGITTKLMRTAPNDDL